MLYSPTHFSITVSMSVRNSLQPDEGVSVGTWIFLVVDEKLYSTRSLEH
ncbi:hypothetical protein FOQG_00495 [Fusarium oxysporum f. sp. raphani 54005]|uniref:Uncharacterized protein n=3 Tax=Fusarium oxysporum TaxID=5507 RepID=X0D1I3_FUSOX|nr:hypothetical protein FOVG_03082 [Fusarium oxysporum f. sp. pisi HDV247]EXL00257.1 hypothetical protein FOQG_00495 [Fusarium oxysporum f. sp. raphani 54005]KAG7435520.1 hypothetical protein Forpi1262_v002796 [Fusarium oxysporum f. sp. raphani]